VSRVLLPAGGTTAEKTPITLKWSAAWPFVVLLLSRLADLWIGGHVDAGSGSVDARHPGSGDAGDVPARAGLDPPRRPAERGFRGRWRRALRRL
jgi:hypothetical protein